MKASDFFILEAEKNSWAHAYLLIGKNDQKVADLIDYIVLQKKCHKADISTVEPEDSSGKKGEIKVEQIKNLLHDVNLSPSGTCRIAVIRNCEKLNQSSGNILLKTIEEPPSYLTFILSAENNSVLPTIKSRCRIITVTSDFDAGSENYAQFLKSDFNSASKKIETIVKENRIETFLDELILHFRNKMLKEKDATSAESIRSIEKIRKDISGNVNPRLALESLYLMVEENQY